MKLLLWIVLGIAGAAIVASIFGGFFGGWGSGGWGWMGGMMAFGWMWMLVPVLLVVVLVYALTNRPGAERSTEDAMAVAERRYAAGEISRDEFQRIQQDIRGGRKS